ncbi:MAG TPA: NADH:flavin oxidoreductase [Propylenella sp.]|nr:NADH:flavin oxidoreductase [Propylenella sp.]
MSGDLTADGAPDPIFQTLRFRNLTVKNRIFRSNISGRFDNEDGSLTQTRINWECKFASRGVGAIISSYVPVVMSGRIIAGYATVHRDDFIPLWAKLGEAVHSFDCKYIMQLSHSGRQMDLPGVHNQHRLTLSPTSRKEPLHGFLTQAMTKADIEQTVQAFARGAWRAREAGLDGVELHAANGYLFTQFLSSGINDRTDEYGGSLANRARFLLEVIAAIRQAVGRDFHLQVKLSAVDRNNVIPWEGKGNQLADTVQVAKWCENAGVDALHVSTGSLFPHPLNPPGDLPIDVLAATYDVLISSGVYGFRNFLLFRYPFLRPIFRWIWFRMKKGRPYEAISIDESRAIKAAVSIPVINTGGYQTASVIRQGIASRAFDAVAIARPLVANPDLVLQWQAGRDRAEVPCTYCNKCLVNAPENPMGCYELARFPSREAMIDQLMIIYRAKPDLRVPTAGQV